MLKVRKWNKTDSLSFLVHFVQLSIGFLIPISYALCKLKSWLLANAFNYSKIIWITNWFWEMNCILKGKIFLYFYSRYIHLWLHFQINYKQLIVSCIDTLLMRFTIAIGHFAYPQCLIHSHFLCAIPIHSEVLAVTRVSGRRRSRSSEQRGYGWLEFHLNKASAFFLLTHIEDYLMTDDAIDESINKSTKD